MTRADPRLAHQTRRRLLAFAGVAEAQPITVAKKALGYVNPVIFRWVRGEPARLRAETLGTLNRWMDENAGWRPQFVRRRRRRT